MSDAQIDAVRLALRTLRLLDDGRRAVSTQWQRWTSPDSPADEQPPRDRRKPPELW